MWSATARSTMVPVKLSGGEFAYDKGPKTRVEAKNIIIREQKEARAVGIIETDDRCSVFRFGRSP